MTRIPIGQLIKQFPAGTFNRLVDDLERRQKGQPPGNDGGPGAVAPPHGVFVRVVNETGAALEEYGIAKLDEPSFTAPTISGSDEADEATLANLTFDLAAATASDTDAPVVVTREPIADGEPGMAMVQGVTWARVEVSDAGHEYATPTTSDSSKFTSTENATRFRILYKQSGTGTKWAVVELGSSGTPADIIYARVNNTGGTSADTNLYAYDSGVSITGCVTASATGQFRNNGQVLPDNQRMILVKRQDTGEYEPDTAGGSAGIALFRLTADMALSASYGTGKPTDDTGAVDSGATAVRLLNWGNRWHGFGPYTDGDTAAASYEGSLVAAVFVTDDHESSGVAGWAIVDCEGWADTLVVKLYAGTSGTPPNVSGQCLIQDPGAFGLESSGRLPRVESDNYDLTAYDPHDMAAEALADQWWVVRYDAANDEYVFLQEFEWSIIRGQCTTTVTSGATTFTINSLELVQGTDLGLGSSVSVQKEYLWAPGTALSATFNNLEQVTVAFDKHDGKWRLFSAATDTVVFRCKPTSTLSGGSSFTGGTITEVLGEKPSGSTVSVDNPLALYASTSDWVTCIKRSDDTYEAIYSQNHVPQWLKGQPNYNASNKQIFTNDAGTLEWNEVADVLAWLTGYTLANAQSIGKDAASTPEWQDDTTCA